ncbi:glycine betaine/L-proline ABC transporter ATP-binding protein [Marihabitans asiaticum]|uniref:Glycine betaine/proline transport system ATP-binding protein n=1 Tax=Marihabitans asiaticum TaxID=415218 RepID=A0A560WDB0_9MICO|nr:glycine betaine/L-proline ABC transporter ATP-binding protein [Marihabitans asiaticum]TWD15566.1 glycine betaine/proline transport system ATP-binding protein [Marihabitans asiaticum]
MSAISVSHLYKVFGRRPERGVTALQQGRSRAEIKEELGLTAAVVDVDFEIEPGEIFVVMGLSGSGKSTLIRMVNGLLTPTDGDVTLGDVNVTRAKGEELRRVRREKVSMVFQHFALLPHRTVGENAAYALEVQGVNRADRHRKAEEALEMVDLGGWGGYRPDELSGGMRQRVGLARALAAGSDILLMDEAFSALDPLIRRGMQDQLVDLQNRLDKTILFITHDLNEAMRLGDRIAMMRDGRIEQIGTAQEILNDPVNNYVASFVQDVDRSRVLTAADVLESPPAVIGRDSGPLAAQKLMREGQMRWLVVQGRDRRLVGMVEEGAVAQAVSERSESLPIIGPDQLAVAAPDTLLADMYTSASQNQGPVVVLDEQERVLGTVPLVTLLAAGGNPEVEPPAEDSPTTDGGGDTDPHEIYRPAQSETEEAR